MEGTYEYSNWVIFGLAVYMVGILGVGYYASTKVHSTSDYLVAGRKLGLFYLTGTLFATWFGAGTAMGGAGNAYLFGNQGVLFDPWGAALALVVVGLFFARMMRRGKFLTTIDVLETRFSNKMGALSAVVLGVADLGWLAGMLVGFGTIVQKFTGIEMHVAIIIATIIVVAYTYMGGMWAVTLTDVWQMFILLTGLGVMFFYMWPHSGGFESLFSNAPANWSGINQWSFLPTSAAAANPEFENAGFFYYTGHQGWFYWFAALTSIGLGVVASQSLMQRFLGAKNEVTAVRAGYIGALMYSTIGMIPILIGMIYFKINPDLGINEALNNILIYSAIDYLPPVATVIFIVALTAAIMSSADSILLAVAALVGNNLYYYVKPDVTDEEVLKVTRRSIPVVALGALAIALLSQSLYNLVVASGMVAMVGIVVPFFAAYFWKKANNLGAMFSVLGGGVFWVIGYFYYLPMTSEANTGIVEEGVVYFDWAMWDALYISSIWGIIASLTTLVVVSLATQKLDPPKGLVDVDGNPLEVQDWLGNPFKSSPEELEAALDDEAERVRASDSI